MALYLVSYDIENVDDFNTRSKNIRKMLENMGGIWILDSQWILHENQTDSTAIKNRLKHHLDPMDHLLVNELTLTRADWFNIPELDRI